MNYPFDYSDVRGQRNAIAAIEQAAIAGHGLLLIGPPGCGKIMVARRAVTILPDLTLREAWQTAEIYGRALAPYPVPCKRPFCAPHFTISQVGMTGRQTPTRPRPGQVSLAHNGVLLLDDVHEFRRSVLESFVHAVTAGSVHFGRNGVSHTFLSRPRMLLFAAQPCCCGYLGHEDDVNRCSCTASQIARYAKRIDMLQPLIGATVTMPAVSYSSLITAQPGEASATIRARVLARS